MAIPDPSPTFSPLELAQRQKAVLIRIVQMAFLTVFATVTILSIVGVNPGSQKSEVERSLWPVTLTAAVVILVIVTVIDVLTPNKRISTLMSIFLGLLAGLLATFAIGRVIDLYVVLYEIKLAGVTDTIKVLLGIALSYLGIVTVLHTQDDFRLVIPYVEFAKQIRGPKPLILDSSALIDARILEVISTGLIQAPLVIPRFVIAELQALADLSDKTKRARGKRGLEIVSKLQREGQLDVTIDETPVPGKAVDQMLVELARQMPGNILTTDAPLARVAQIQGVTAVNINDVAAAFKPALVLGEQVTIRVVRRGEQPGQGVGYLDDGTMLVVEDGAEAVGQDVQVEVTGSLQTSAGRLIFARRLGRTEASAAIDASVDAAPTPPASFSAPPPLPAAGEAMGSGGPNPPETDPPARDGSGRGTPTTGRPAPGTARPSQPGRNPRR